MEMRGLFLLPGLVCLFLGVVFLLIFRHMRSRQEVMDRSIKAKTWGKLTDTGSRIERDYDNRTHTVHFGIYDYDTADGQHISSASDFCYTNPELIPGSGGDMVKILYDPDKPTEFVIPEERVISIGIWSSFKKAGIIMLVIGIPLTVAAAAWLFGFFDPFLESLL